MPDLILEKYNRELSRSIMSTLESERIMRVNSIDLNSILIQEQTEIEASKEPYVDPETADRLKKITATGITAYGKGYAKRKIKNAARKKYIAKGRPIVEKGLKTLGLSKYIPVLGSLVALLSLSFNLYQLLKETKIFTSKILKYSKVELSGARSFLGQYSIFDASAEDMAKVAEALSKNITEDQRKDLRLSYNSVLEEAKDVILDVLLGIKDITAELAIPVAVLIHMTPAERLLKDVFFKAHKTVNKLVSSMPEFLRMIFRILSFGPSLFMTPYKLTPLIGFLNDRERIAEFAKIDDVIDTPRLALDRVEDLVDYSGRKAGGVSSEIDSFADPIDVKFS
jgi:hypothetical protein